jgi:selenium-binding protein 1
MVTEGLNPELLLAGSTGTSCMCGTSTPGSIRQAIDLGKEQQMVLEPRPAHDPRKTYGFAGVVISLENLSASIWTWYLDQENGKRRRVEGEEDHRDPGGAGRSGATSADAQGLSAWCRHW